MSIKQLLSISTLVVAILLISGAVFTLWVFANAQQQLERTLYSYEQLSIATGMETDAARALLADTQRRLGFEPAAALVVDEDAVNGDLEALISRIRDEIGSITDPDEQVAETDEFVAAFAIRQSYARLARALEERGPQELALDQQALAQFIELDGLLADVIADEREEVEVAVAELELFREQLRRYAFGAAFFAVAAIIVAAVFGYRSLMRPLRALDSGSEELASGNIAHRIDVLGPPELRHLALRLNEMAGRLETQQRALRESNERLEETVAERTAELAEKAQTLQLIDESRRLFFAKVGHELRTPLTVLLGETEVALTGESDDIHRYREALQHIGANGEHLKRRIADLMAVARSEDGRLQIERADVDLISAARETIEATRGFAASNDVELSFRSDDQQLSSRVDGDWLKQALMALIDNAVKFAPMESVVELSVLSENQEVVLSVADRGAGIGEEELPNITKPYFQGENVQGRIGTGLGLAVAHWVAQQHDGYLTAKNRVGGGLRVSLHLPLDELPG